MLLTALLGGAACGGASGAAPGGGGAGQGGSGTGGEAGGAAGLRPRGEYLVRHVLRCPDCHTPHDASGVADADRFLAGAPCAVDVDPPPDNGRGCLPAPNLTDHPTGLQSWTDDEIEAALRDGRARGGRQLAAQMPYFQFRALAGSDLQAVIAFLRSVPGVDHVVGPPEAPYDRAFAAVPPIAVGDLPLPEGGAGMAQGRYLTMLACFGCHTPAPASTAGAPAPPFDLTRAFAGGRQPRVGATAGAISANLTPDATGLAGWTVEDLMQALVAGVDRSGARLCPPMPAGPNGAFAGLLEGDLRDIGTYLLALPPLDNRVEPSCR